MKPYLKQITLVASVFLLASCGGSGSSSDSTTGGGDTTTRVMSGSVLAPTPNVTARVSNLVADDCLADTILATTVAGTTTSATVNNEGCTFSLSLEVDQSYSISLIKDDQFVATLIFDTGSGYSSSNLFVVGGSTAIDLGAILVNGTVATAENEPLDQNDCDDDGVSDLDDDDDDNDDVRDHDEDDCDLDGVIDDHDDDEDMCDAIDSTTTAQVYEVKPRDEEGNDDHDDDGEHEGVDLDKDVRARVGCLVDEATVTSETFSVVGNEVALVCTYAISTDDSEEESNIKCLHSDPFLADTTYTATLDGVMCLDGRTVESVTWTFNTAISDDSDGDSEDDFDDDHDSEDHDSEDDDNEDHDNEDDDSEDDNGSDD